MDSWASRFGVWSAVLLLLLLCASGADAGPYARSLLPKVWLFLGDGGNAHRAAADCLENNLGHRYNFTHFNFHQDQRLLAIDPMVLLSRDHYNSGTFFETLLREGYPRVVNHMATLAQPLFPLYNSYLVPVLEKLLEEERPAAIFSVFVIINHGLWQFAAKHNIPLLCAALDLDLSMWLPGFEEERGTYSNFHLFVFRNTSLVTQQLQPLLEHKVLTPARIHWTGPVLRSEFYPPKLLQHRTQQRVKSNEVQILLIRGGSGSDQLWKWVPLLIDQWKGPPLHLVLVAGKNQAFAQMLQERWDRLQAKAAGVKPHRLTVLMFTPHIGTWMANSTAVISFPSPTTAHEVLQLGVPIFLDYTGAVLFWETHALDELPAGPAELVHPITDPAQLPSELLDVVNHPPTPPSFLSRFPWPYDKIAHVMDQSLLMAENLAQAA